LGVLVLNHNEIDWVLVPSARLCGNCTYDDVPLKPAAVAELPLNGPGWPGFTCLQPAGGHLE